MSKDKKMLIVIVLVIGLLIAMISEVLAVGYQELTLDVLDEDATNAGVANAEVANAEVANAETANAVYANQAAGRVVQPDLGSGSNNKTNTESKLPQTGVTEDITLMFFIVICTISAIYAYRKIKNYNV